MHLCQYMQRTCLSLLCSFLTAASATAQEERTFSAQSNLVRVPTLVLDRNGAPVLGLSLANFIVEDDGIAQTAHMDEGAESEPVSMMIAIQCGRRAKREYGRMKGLSSTLDPVLSNPQSEAAVLFFDSKLNLARNFASNADGVEMDLQKLPSGDSGAAILDAIAYSARLLGQRPKDHKRVLLLISETRDHGSQFTKLDEALKAVDGNEVSVYALPFSPYVSQQLDDLRGSNRDEWTPGIDLLARFQDIGQAMRKNIPQAIAHLSGGEYQRFSTQSAFENHLIDFANHLHSRYELSFEPNHPHPGLHQIRVRMRDPNSDRTLICRTTYWVRSGGE